MTDPHQPKTYPVPFPPDPGASTGDQVYALASTTLHHTSVSVVWLEWRRGATWEVNTAYSGCAHTGMHESFMATSDELAAALTVITRIEAEANL